MIAIFPGLGGGMVVMTGVDELMSVALGEGWWCRGERVGDEYVLGFFFLVYFR